MTKAPTTREEALQRDAADPLADRAALFDLPDGVTYLVGHSLGPPPKGARDRLAAALDQRRSIGVRPDAAPRAAAGAAG